MYDTPNLSAQPPVERKPSYALRLPTRVAAHSASDGQGVSGSETPGRRDGAQFAVTRRSSLERTMEAAANTRWATAIGMHKPLMRVSKSRHLSVASAVFTGLLILSVISVLDVRLPMHAPSEPHEQSPERTPSNATQDMRSVRSQQPAPIPVVLQDNGSKRDSSVVEKEQSERPQQETPLNVRPVNSTGRGDPNHVPSSEHHDNAVDIPPTSVNYKDLIGQSCREKRVGSPMCPSLFVIGAQKAGTTSIADWLMDADMVFPGEDPVTGERIKEMHFFTKRNLEVMPDTATLQERTWKEYISKFPKRVSARQVGLDSTPDYIHSPSSPVGMIESGVYQKSSRFIIVFRDPVDRAVSLFAMSQRDYAVGDLTGRGDLRTFNDKYQWNFSAIAEQCIPLVTECRAEARQLGKNPFTHCVGNHATSRVECQMFHRGFYADQIRSWLDAGFETSNFCAINLLDMANDATAAVMKRAGRCLRDVGLDLSMLPPIPERPENVGNYSRIDERHPGLRERLNERMYNAGRKDLEELLRNRFPSWAS